MRPKTSFLLVAFFCLALVSPVAAQTLDGAWSGTGLQRDQPPQMYPIEMTIQGNSGVIEYPSLDCGGTLTRKPGELALEGYQQFTEKITHGSGCIDGGTIYVRMKRGRLIWFWGDFIVIAIMERRK